MTITANNLRIYADYNATGLVEPSHYELVISLLKKLDGNPSSPHARGRGAKVALEQARNSVAPMVGARAQEIIFTSGATEANNLALQGAVLLGRKIIVSSAAEHPSVAETVQVARERYGADVWIVGTGHSGAIDEAELLGRCAGGAAVIVTLILANNEVGTVIDGRSVAAKIRAVNAEAHIHVDAVQALGKLDLSWVASSEIDTLSLSAHKIGAFKGVGALYVRGGTKLETVYTGGAQERNRRPGTENLPGIVSFGKRCEELLTHNPWQASTLANYRRAQNILVNGLRQIKGCQIHGEPELGLWNTVNFHIDGMGGDALLMNLDLAGVDASSGSACSTGVGRPSPVLKAMGHSDWEAGNSVRLSFGYDFDDGVAARVLEIVRKI